MAPYVVALVTLQGSGDEATPPGQLHEVKTDDEAEALVRLRLAKWPDGERTPEPEPGLRLVREDANEDEPEDDNDDAELADDLGEDLDSDGEGEALEDAEEDTELGDEAEGGTVLFASAAAKQLAEKEGLTDEQLAAWDPSSPNGYTKGDVEAVIVAVRTAGGMGGE